MDSSKTLSNNNSVNLNRLKQKYVKNLAPELVNFRRVYEMVSSGNVSQQELKDLYRKTHNFSGSGTTFGFPAISIAAKSLSAVLDRYMEQSLHQNKTTSFHLNVMQKIEALEQAISHACIEKVENPESKKVSYQVSRDSGQQDVKVVIIADSSNHDAQRLDEKIRRFGYNVQTYNNISQIKMNAQLEAACGYLIFTDLNDKDIEALSEHHFQDGKDFIIVMAPDNTFDRRLAAAKLNVKGYLIQNVEVLRVIEKIERLTHQSTNQNSHNILVVDDDEMLVEFYSHTLKNVGMKVSATTNSRNCIHSLNDSPFDLILIDYDMPNCNGYELATIIRQDDRFVSVPIVFMSAKEDVEDMFIDSQLGIEDFLIKPFTPQHLVSAIRSRVLRAEELKSLMIRDSFTGLFNHAHFLEVMSNEFDNSKRSGRKTTYATIDIDLFKKVNDTYGHAAGDRVIQTMSHMLKQNLRRTDVIGRCGGEEFGILMTDTDPETAEQILNNLRVKFSEMPFYFEGAEVYKTFSGGIVALERGDTFEAVVKAADDALYEAKEGGRNNLVRK